MIGVWGVYFGRLVEGVFFLDGFWVLCECFSDIMGKFDCGVGLLFCCIG